MTEKLIEKHIRLAVRTAEMREKQKRYFKTPYGSERKDMLKEAVESERIVDEILKEIESETKSPSLI